MFAYEPDDAKGVTIRRPRALYIDERHDAIGHQPEEGDMRRAAIAVILAALVTGAGAGSAGGQTLECTIMGTPGSDQLMGTPGADVICGLGGNDRIFARGGDDVVIGGRGADRIAGGKGIDNLRGGRGADIVTGGRDADTLLGGRGPDLLVARDGVEANDTADGGLGADRCRADTGDTVTSC
jgi:Ca2+-binding RTX toxin-like protein